MNELLFFLQIMTVAGFVLGALALGREALVAVISLLFVLANIFVVKQMTLFGFNVTSADVYIVGAVLGFNLLQEYFGKAITKKTIWISFFISFFSALMAQIHLWYFPNIYDLTQVAFVTVLGCLPRIVFASLVAHVLAQYVQAFMYSLLKKKFKERYFLVRNFGSIIVGQVFDTFLFGIIGLYGIVHTLTDVFIVSLCIKIITILLVVPWVLFSKKIVKYSFEKL